MRKEKIKEIDIRKWLQICVRVLGYTEDDAYLQYDKA